MVEYRAAESKGLREQASLSKSRIESFEMHCRYSREGMQILNCLVTWYSISICVSVKVEASDLQS
jgi:hypothetical protein